MQVSSSSCHSCHVWHVPRPHHHKPGRRISRRSVTLHRLATPQALPGNACPSHPQGMQSTPMHANHTLEKATFGASKMEDKPDQNTIPRTTRRASLIAMTAGGLPTLLLGPSCPQAYASKLPGFADRAWESLGGGPADLVYPEPLLGKWTVTSVLTKVETPMGEQVVPDMNIVNRAKAEDLNRKVQYEAAFIRNKNGEVICDRAFNVASLLSYYYNRPVSDYLSRTNWNPDDPNVLTLNLQGGLAVRMRVTRRAESFPDPSRVETSEYFEQVYDTSNAPQPQGPAGVKVKASQCFTKYKWRRDSETAPGQPSIVATQVVSDYLTPENTTDAGLLLQTMNNPIVIYTYKMAFTRAA
ncbi:hypothetical protein DUNSADRAFT_1063 [Dunaliella salina]|uniref:DUF6816 domain-containing protein n=1 Tax=Dunaliella salina TaxID=3046 RepID=A0ABQ7FY23_DUNSA|nr:hypothetical protein DUNSADRAFT_1063 [Dunaliella salina]|eukprot:KAF5827256.1 hypothetical protein DUNSADRAFT_1063 [Dunaliella salina]